MSNLTKREVSALKDLAKASRRIKPSIATPLIQRQLASKVGEDNKNGVHCAITTHGRRALRDV